MKKDCQRLYINALLTETTTPEEKQTLTDLAEQNEKIKEMQEETIQNELDAESNQKAFEETFIEKNVGEEPDTSANSPVPPA